MPVISSLVFLILQSLRQSVVTPYKCVCKKKLYVSVVASTPLEKNKINAMRALIIGVGEPVIAW